jgi:monoamine oxidase
MPLPARWDEAIDIIIVGSGFAGWAAAAAGAAGGAVVIVEKMPQYGGNSAINMGDFAAWDDGLHRRAALGLATTAPSGTPPTCWPPASITVTLSSSRSWHVRRRQRLTG